MNKIVMKKENIKLNYKYKNWKELLETLGLKWTTNNKQRERYLEELKLSFELHKEGNGFVFTKVIDLEACREDKRGQKTSDNDKRKGNSGKSENSRNNYKGIYIPYSTKLMLDYFRRLSKDVIYITNNTLAEEIGAVNQNYSVAKINAKQFNQYMYETYDCCNATAKKDLWYNIKGMISNDIVEATLKNLQKNEYIEFEKGYILEDEIITGNEEMEELKSQLTLANSEEKKIINNIEKKVAKEMGYDDRKNIKDQERIKFYRQCAMLVKEAFNKYRDELQIGHMVKFNKYYVGYRVKIFETIEPINDIGKLQFELNNIVIERAYDKFVKKYNKQIEENNNKTSFDMSVLEEWEIEMYQESLKSMQEYELKQWEKDRVKESYLTDAEKLIEVVLKKGYRNISYIITLTKYYDKEEHKTKKIGLQNN